MSGEKRLDKLLSGMSPELLEGEYVFCSFEDAAYGDLAELQPVAAIREVEGLTLVIAKDIAAAHDIDFDAVFKCITLKVHSSLDAVGLTAAFSKQLARYDISANVVAGFFHDHIFVQTQSADAAMRALSELSMRN